MKYLRLKYIVIVCSVFTVFSCADLDLEPRDSLPSTVVWEDSKLIDLYVNARYAELPHGFPKWAGGLRFTGITDEAYSQDQNFQLDRYTNFNAELTSDKLSNYYWGGFWLEAYDAIKNSNIFFENIDTFSGTADQMNTIKKRKAEVRFLRAFFYVELISRYGGVPLIKKSFKLSEDFRVPRASFEECLDFIIQELDLAIADLPDKADSMGANFGRATKGAAIGLKIRALMFHASPLFNSGNDVSRWGKVATACEQLFALPGYSISSDYKDIFLNARNSEVIFFKQFVSTQFPNELLRIFQDDDDYYHWDYAGGQEIDQWRFPSGTENGWTSENPRQDFVDQYETKTGKIAIIGYTGSASNLTPIYNSGISIPADYDPDFPYKNRDPRLGYSVFYDGAVFKGREIEFWEGGKDSRTNGIPNSGNGSKLSYGIRKSLDESWAQGNNLFGKQPWIHMRLSEFYLTYAEAKYHLGDFATAVNYVNMIRNRADVAMPNINSSGDLLAKIKHERKIELAFEGNRFYDVRRWKDINDYKKDIVGVRVLGDANEKSYEYFYQDGAEAGKRSLKEHQCLFPIPLEEIQKSPFIKQNPGYFPFPEN